MFINPLIRTCTDCASAHEAICRIDDTLARYGKNKYFNESYLTSRAFPKDRIKLIQYYRGILVNTLWNDKYYEPYFSLSTIISRVKVLTNGL